MSVCICIPTVQAQSTAEKYFEQGEKSMATMTRSNQEAAIESFTKAKVAFDSEAKKLSCDRHVAICKEIIKVIAKNDDLKKQLSATDERKTADSVKPVQSVKSAQTDNEVDSSQLLNNVEIKVSNDNIILMSDGGEFITIAVESTYPEWHLLDNYPAWLTCVEHQDELRIMADYNDSPDARAAKLTIESGGAIVTILVTQQGLTLAAKIKHNLLTPKK